MGKTCQIFQKIRIIVYLILGIPFITGIIWWVLNQTVDLPFHLAESRFHMVFIPLVDLLIFFVLFNIYCEKADKKTAQPFWILVLTYSLINIIIVFLLRRYYLVPSRAQYPSVQAIIQKTTPLILVFLVLLTCFSLFKIFSKRIIALWKTFSFEEKIGDRKKKRLQTFIFLSLSLIIGLGLRLYHLGELPPYVDEYPHTHAAYQLLQGEQSSYFRGFLTVTLPVFLSYRVFGLSLFASRLPMVLLNMASIFPLFALSKKINKTVAYISVFLFITNPWIIAVSRTIREYAVAPLIFYLSASLLMDLLDWDGRSLKQYLKTNIVRVIVLVLILAYLRHDDYSIIKIGFAIYGAFGAIVTLISLKQKKSRWLTYSLLALCVVILVFIVNRSGLIYRYASSNVLIFPWTPIYFDTLILSNFQQSYYLGFIGYLVLFVSLISALWVITRDYRKNNFALLFNIIIFFAFFIIITFLIQPEVRYGAMMEYWYLPLVAIFLYLVYICIQYIFKQKVPATIAFLLILFGLFTNYSGIYQIFTYKGGEHFAITDEFHFRVAPAYGFLSTQLTKEDILLTDTMQMYGELIGRKPLETYQTIIVKKYHLIEGESALDFIETYPSGWIAVSLHARPWLYDIPDTDFEHAGTQVKFIGLMGDVYLWHWKKP